jgi:hypothetical protein
VDLVKLINQENFKESVEKFKILSTKVNLKITYLMDGVDTLIIKEFIGDSGLTDLGTAVESGYQPVVKQKREIGQWVF